jgi:hypothetical protein
MLLSTQLFKAGKWSWKCSKVRYDDGDGDGDDSDDDGLYGAGSATYRNMVSKFDSP